MKKDNYNLVKLNTARNCIRYIIRAFKIKEIYIPYYICPSVRISISKENCKINYYHIDVNFNPKENFPEDSYILYPDYFGICSHISDKAALKYKNLIIDNAHSLLSKPNGAASFNSIRKFFPYLLSGAFLYIKSDENLKFEADEYKYNFDDYSFKKFLENENRLDYEEIKYISKYTQKEFFLIDIEKEKKRREDKFNQLHNIYGSSNGLKINSGNIQMPFCYPYLAKDNNEALNIVKELKSKGLNIFRYWNNLPDNFEEKIFYDRLVAIPL